MLLLSDITNALTDIQSWILQRTHEATQTLASDLHPVANDRDIRHSADKVMEYPAADGSQAEYIREGVKYTPDARPALAGERAGVAHLVHAWRQQNHTVRSCFLISIPLLIIR